MHLLAALAGRPGDVTVVAAQGQIDTKSNEVPHATEVLDQISDLRGAVVTADALHTVKATATHIHTRGAFYMLPVKENRPALYYDAVNALAWTQTRSRTPTPTSATPGTPDAPSACSPPHPDCRSRTSNRSTLIERYVHTNLPATLARPADLAGYTQDHRGVESLHWLRDTLYQKDASTTRTPLRTPHHGHPAHLAIGALRLAGRHDITEATRWANRYMHRPFTILQLPI